MPTQSRGRPVKFTPERIQQIKNLVERSKSREEIAELIGVRGHLIKTRFIAPPRNESVVKGGSPQTDAQPGAGDLQRVQRSHTLGMAATCT